MAEYNIRPYEARDRERFVQLHSSHLSDISNSYVKWKFENNPFIEETPILITEHESEIVGARPFFVLEMTDGDDTYQGLNFGNTVVHKDHRGQGLLTKMTSRALEHFSEDRKIISYGSPGEIPWKAYKKVGFDKIDNSRHEFWRIQNPRKITDSTSLKYRVPGLFSNLIYPPYRSFRDKLEPSLGEEYDIESFSTPPVDVLVSLYQQDIPQHTIHTIRDETYFQWRYNNPKYEYEFYVISRSSKPVGAVITGTDSNGTGDSTVTRFLDILPITLREKEPTLILEILREIISNDGKTNLYRQPGFLHEYVDLSKLGFFSTGGFPLSWLYPKEGSFVVWLNSELDSQSKADLVNYSDWMIDVADFNPY